MGCQARRGAAAQAFYIPWGQDLQRWAATHPEYTRPQLASLVALVAESQVPRRTAPRRTAPRPPPPSPGAQGPGQGGAR